MSFVRPKNEFNGDFLACRACLATNRKLYSLQQDELLIAYKNLIGSDVYPYDMYPQYICNYCAILLLKYNKFRENCQKATLYLEEARIRNIQITSDYINNFEPHIKHEISQTNTTDNNINITDENIPDFKINENSIDDLNIDLKADDDNDEDIHHKYNSENIIYTQEIKIEKETKIRKKSVKKADTVKKKGKYFETKEKMTDFEKNYEVDVIILSDEQQLKEVLDRKSSSNYLNSPHKCELCFKGYMSSDVLNKHIMSQHDPSRGSVVCELCKFRYKDRRSLNQHLKSHRLKFACKQCSYVSRTTFNAKEHYKMHAGHMHKCRHCGKSYEKLSSHLSHLRIHHPSEFIWCNVCGEAFIGSFGLNAHKKRAHRHLGPGRACERCGAQFVVRAALARHAASRSVCARHSCTHCGDAFEHATNLREHLLEKHRRSEEFTCEKCNKTFARESLYSAHYKRLHVDSKEKAARKQERPWVCEVCGKTLPNRCVLLYHQRTHTGEKPYHCTQCPKRFTMKKLLQSHLRVHTNDRPYICKLCPKAFKGLSALRAHEHIHTGGQTKSSSKNRML